MRFGMCTGMNLIPDAAAAGYAYVEMAVGALVPEEDEAAFAPVREQILAAPLVPEAFNCFIPGHIKVTGPAVDLDRVRQYMETAIRRVAEVGGKTVVFGSGGARALPEGFPVNKGWYQLADAARIAADIAANHDVTIVMEPLLKRACNLFNRVDEGAAFVDQVNHPRLRLLTDLFHFAAEDEPYEHILAAGKRFAHVHLATPAIPATGEGVAYDFKGFLNALVQAGYDGRVSVEDNPGLLGGKQPPLTEIYRAILEYVISNLPVKA